MLKQERHSFLSFYCKCQAVSNLRPVHVLVDEYCVDPVSIKKFSLFRFEQVLRTKLYSKILYDNDGLCSKINNDKVSVRSLVYDCISLYLPLLHTSSK